MENGPPRLTGGLLARRLAVPVVLVLAVSMAHGAQAHSRGESIVPVVMAAVLGVGIVLGVFYFVAGRREGALPAGDRSALEIRRARLLRWVVPLAIVAAILSAIGKIMSSP